MTLYDRAKVTLWGYRDISPRAISEAGDTLVVDVREPYEHAAGHIPGARLVPITLLGTVLPGWDHRGDIVIVCRTGARSAGIAEALVSAGFHRVMNLAGDMLAYENAGLPIEREPARAW